ncbi:hydrolase, UxaA family [Salmonella enterica subsp. enterica]|nr:hydrolase, UxaA family [Salmonella enterica subsp. enterica]
MHKAGHAPLQGVLEYADSPTHPGLWIMDTPGQDIESISGMVAGGAQIVIFYYRSRNACR